MSKTREGEFFFNFVFAATAATITSGALAERVELWAYFLYSLILTGFVQPVTVHWCWSNGFLLYPPSGFGIPPTVFFRDYAGGCNVHAVGGVAALVACAFIRPRIGRDDNGTLYHIPGHSTSLTGLGAFILITGFLGMVLGHGNNIELSSVNIILGGACSGCTAMMVKYLKPKFHNWRHGTRKPQEIVAYSVRRNLSASNKIMQLFKVLVISDSCRCNTLWYGCTLCWCQCC